MAQTSSASLSVPARVEPSALTARRIARPVRAVRREARRSPDTASQAETNTFGFSDSAGRVVAVVGAVAGCAAAGPAAATVRPSRLIATATDLPESDSVETLAPV